MGDTTKQIKHEVKVAVEKAASAVTGNDELREKGDEHLQEKHKLEKAHDAGEGRDQQRQQRFDTPFIDDLTASIQFTSVAGDSIRFLSAHDPWHSRCQEVPWVLAHLEVPFVDLGAG